MAYLSDTNVLLRYLKSDDPKHQSAVQAVDALFDAGEEVCIVPQNLIEFWNVATRPSERNGYELSPAQAQVQLASLESVFSLRLDSPDIYAQWRRLVIAHNVAGVQVHDTRLVAAMLVHSLTHLLTFNGSDFHRFVAEGISLVDPGDLAQEPGEAPSS